MFEIDILDILAGGGEGQRIQIFFLSSRRRMVW